jgi:putative CocE/NonD family hydrolase
VKLKSTLVFTVMLGAFATAGVWADQPASPPDSEQVKFQWGVKIPLRDGVKLNATVYTPRQQKEPAPCVFTLTPYISQSYHDRGMYFAAHGYPFLTVDVRGRGNSEGEFRPLIQEARDGHDVVEWLATQPYCNGKVTMWGGSYAGYDQWVTAKEFPPHLATIVPVASPYAGIDFPMRANIAAPYLMQWLTFTSGKASQANIFADAAFWGAVNRQWFESGKPFKELDSQLGNPNATFQEWMAHPQLDSYWDSYNPTSEQYARLSLPILTITGSYDGDQPGAIEHYRQHMKHGNAEAKAQHYLVIGPWDHAGTRTPQAKFGGMTFGQPSLVDLPKLHLDWYAWTMQNGSKPEFLQKRVAYYVMGADRWRYADTLEAVTAESRSYFLDSNGGAADVLASGSLSKAAGKGKPDQYVYDPRDLSIAEVERDLDPSLLTDQTTVYQQQGKVLVYHTAPFERDTEVSGFFKLSAWLAIDQPDTDFSVSVYEILPDASSVFLTNDLQRARYRESEHQAKLVTTREPLKYEFDGFTFTSRMVRKGSRLRLVIGPVNSTFSQKNYNSGGDVSSETLSDARTVTVKLYHDRSHQSSLVIPIGQP